VLPTALPGCWVQRSNELVHRAGDQGDLEESSEGDSERQRETECVAGCS